MRQQLKAQGIDDSWQTLRQTLSTQQRVTTTLQRKDGRMVHVRKAARPEPSLGYVVPNDKLGLSLVTLQLQHVPILAQRQQPCFGINRQLFARIHDVQVAQGELANAVGR